MRLRKKRGGSRPRALVLGSGPAGMFATHALVESGFEVVIWSKRGRSDLFGAQYLHSPIPGLAYSRSEIRYELIGTVEGYARKVYQDGIPIEDTSVAKFVSDDSFEAWDIRVAYRDAFDRYSHLIELWEVPAPGAVFLGQMKSVRDFHADIKISTIPADRLCWGGHHFRVQKVWAAGDAPERGWKIPVICPIDTVQCSGEPDVGWYRRSDIFGRRTIEWPKKPSVNWAAEVNKPLYTNCDCNQELTRIGRYGAWQKGYLAHQAYEEVKAMTS